MTGVRPDIAHMQGYVPGEQLAPGKYIKLNTNENPYGASPKALQAIRAAATARLARYPDPHATAFRIQAAELLGVPPDSILCGNGSDDILTIVTRAFVAAGQAVRMPYPSYILYRTLAEIQGADCQQVPFADDWSLTADFGRHDPHVRLVFLPNPNSPSGTLLPADVILDLAERVDAPVLIDEAYVDFASANCADLVRRDSRIMVCRTLSKSYGLAGLRFGYLIADPAVVHELLKVKDSYNCDALSIAGATAALTDRQWLAECRQRIAATRTRLQAALVELGFRVQPSHANFVWCSYPGRPLRPVYEKLKDGYVLVRYMNYSGWGEGLRITVGTDGEVDACLSLLKAIINDDATGND